jgi:hypothetical protein
MKHVSTLSRERVPALAGFPNTPTFSDCVKHFFETGSKHEFQECQEQKKH